MEIKDFLTPDAVFELRETDKGRVLKELACRASALVGMDFIAIETALVQREHLGSTGLGNGIALPHARIANLTKPFGLFALLKTAVQFDAIDERPVDLIFLLLLPELHPEGQLKAMACVARRLRDPVLAGRLRASRGSVPLYALLTANDAGGR
ncbi:PTS sugar transporter subunit IIA [Lichenihabitans psoromatis]|uniref:PTS sugar transporter subunit IIA n=1 Tax=Lichenihabitans psoromatis TaxID=2528642 RepID=UPI0010362437|nr:PTS sugar transporter subunit IIA [Lichenihabitans psoromatis]